MCRSVSRAPTPAPAPRAPRAGDQPPVLHAEFSRQRRAHGTRLLARGFKRDAFRFVPPPARLEADPSSGGRPCAHGRRASAHAPLPRPRRAKIRDLGQRASRDARRLPRAGVRRRPGFLCRHEVRGRRPSSGGSAWNGPGVWRSNHAGFTGAILSIPGASCGSSRRTSGHAGRRPSLARCPADAGLVTRRLHRGRPAAPRRAASPRAP